MGPEEAADLDDIGMVKPCQCARFIEETIQPPVEVRLVLARLGLHGQGLLAHREVRRHVLLDRHRLVQGDVTGKVCDPEPA